MTHLSQQEMIDALEGVLETSRMGHVETCEACRLEVRAYREVMGDLTTEGPIPEPSPLFWGHLRRRVRAATGAERVAPRFGWLVGWKTVTALGMVAASFVLIATLRSGTRSDLADAPAPADAIPASDESAASIQALLVTELEPWAVVADAASELSLADLQAMPAPILGSVDWLVEELTVEERAELLRLLRVEMGGRE